MSCDTWRCLVCGVPSLQLHTKDGINPYCRFCGAVGRMVPVKDPEKAWGVGEEGSSLQEMEEEKRGER